MAKVKIYRFKDTGTMCLQVSNGDGKVSRHSLPISLNASEWDGKNVTSAHPQRMEVDAYLKNILTEAQLALTRIMREQPTKNMPATELRDLILAQVFHQEEEEHRKTFLEVYDEFTATHTNERTREIYNATRKRICEYEKRDIELEQITRRWLDCFDKWLERRSPSVNARAIHMRNIRAAFNYALDEELTDFYPFGRRRGFKIREEETIHRDLTPEDLLRLFNYQPPTERTNKHNTKPLDYAVKYVDMAKLIFFTIGTNSVDLFNAEAKSFYGGRIKYRRAKTHKLYNIKIEPEAAEIIRKYRGDNMLISLCENRTTYKSLAKQINLALKKISKQLGLPPVTIYWMRHSWATIAYSIGASYDMVSDCLGHKHGSTVTATYVNKKQKRIFTSKDELNRAVIDYVLYGIE